MGMYLGTPSTDKETADGENSFLKYGMSCMQGWRTNMEDDHVAEAEFGENMSLFAVFDGHGGQEVAKYCGKHYARILKSAPAFSKGDYPTALKQSFLLMDEDILTSKGQKELKSYQSESAINSMAGCTANVILIVGKKVFCANAGDSRSYLGQKESSGIGAKPLSVDHKPEDEVEIARIQKAGGSIMMGRVNGNLNLSRAIGDFEYKQNKALKAEEQMITSDPDVQTHELNLSKDKFIIMGCDGVWEIHSGEQICQSVAEQLESGEKVMSKIVGKILDDGLAQDTSSGFGCDNMSGVLIVFKN